MHRTPLARTLGTTLALSLCSVTATASVITFDALTRTGTASLPASYQEAGFQLTAGPGSAFMAWGSNSPSYTGSAAMAAAVSGVGDRLITLSQVGGGAFSLESIDFSEWTVDSDEPFEIVVTATLNGAWVWNFPLFLDGVFGVETFHFGSVFSNVTEVQFGPRGDYSYQFDNVVLGTPSTAEVPEPGSIGLAGVALLGGFLATRRGRAGRAHAERPSR